MKRKSTVEHWDEHWSETLGKGFDHYYTRGMDEIIKFFKNIKNRKVLEVGAGSGTDSFYLLKKCNTENYCLDFSKKALKYMKSYFSKEKTNVKVIGGELRSIPFQDNSFDIVFSGGVLEHFKDPVNIILEQKRILKSGGLLVIGVPYTYTLLTIYKHILILFNKWRYGWETQFSRTDLKRFMKESDMYVEKVYLDCFPLNWLPYNISMLIRKTWLDFPISGGVVIWASKK